MNIKPYREVAQEAMKEINAYQKGDVKPIKTGRPWLDNYFPVLPGNIITISAGSGVGKSYELQKMVNNIFRLNENAENFVHLNISLEMTVRSLLLRDLANKTGIAKKDIIANPFTVEEQMLVDEYMKSIDDDRRHIFQEKLTPSLYKTGVRAFLEKHKEKELVIISIDHMALIAADGNESRNQVMEFIVTESNELKLEYNNVLFVYLSQTNSDLASRAQDGSNFSAPRQGDLYYSGFTFQISDYVVMIVNPGSMGIREYLKLDPSRYPNLSKYFLRPDKKGRVSLETYGVVYYHLMKIREKEGWVVDIFAEDLNIPNLEETRSKLRQEEAELPSVPMPSFMTPAISDTKGPSFV